MWGLSCGYRRQLEKDMVIAWSFCLTAAEGEKKWNHNF